MELNDVETLHHFYSGELHYYFLDPTSDDLDVGLHTLATDQDVQELSQHISVHKLIDVYVQHDVYIEGGIEKPISQVEQVGKKLKIRSISKGNAFVDGIEEPISQVEQIINPDVAYDDYFDFGSLTGNDIENNDSEVAIDDSESDDSDYLVDDNVDIDDVEVDMRDFQKHVDITLKYMGPDIEEEDIMVNHEGIDVLQIDEFDTDGESEDDVGALRKQKIRKMIKDGSDEVSVDKNNFYLGQIFASSKEVKDMIKKHALETRRELKMVRNDKIRIRTICIGTCPQLKNSRGSSNMACETLDPAKCPWTLHISKLKNAETWQVKTFISHHTCLQVRSLKSCTSEFLSHEIVEMVQDNPQIPVKTLQDQIQRKYELGISKTKVFRAKAKALNLLKGDYYSQYGILRDYCLEVQKNNPGTTIKIQVESEPNPNSETRQFKRIYICLGPLKHGFCSGIRELIGLDGAFMKGPFPGQILTAVGLDGNNSIYPVAYGIVEAETLNSWTWFLECLGDDLDLSRNSNFTFISDRQKGIIPAIGKVFPCAEHRFCIRHIHENMKQSWKGKAYKDLLWKCATSSTVEEFKIAMESMKQLSPAAADWLAKIPPHHWSRSHFSGRAHCDVLLNNLCEVLNRQLVDGRDKPIIIALEFIREYLMKRIVNVQQVTEKCNGPLTPQATKTLELIKKEAAKYKVIWAGGSKYQVCGPWMDQFVVDTSEKACTCRKWELSGIPCKHAVAAIWNMSLYNKNVPIPELWVDKAYWLETWKHVYSFKVGPINGRTLWPKSECPTTLIAPKHHKQIGRPKKKRKIGPDEVESMNKGGKLSRILQPVTCSICKGTGHNSRTCKGA